ncbi:MAG: hypothetical protein Q4E33_01980 [Erysipelotrichaceae bacterium]|nr:hypothetical protein [Erysipelotrichaceae bacterium]
MELAKESKKKILIVAIIICLGLFSFFYLGNKFSNPETYENIISILDEKKDNVMGLTASTSAASIAITVIPDDIGTPIANQLADLSSYLLLILTVIYLEKYLLTVIGFAVFKIIVPIVCALFISYVLFPKNFSLKKIGIKIAAFALALVLLIPTSVKISDMIDKTYQDSINETLSVANQEIEIEEQPQQESTQDNVPWYEKLYNYFADAVEDVKDAVTTSTTEAVAKAKTLLSNFIEATAVMIVTSCVVPVLTVIAFVWITKLLLGIEINKNELIEMKEKVKSITTNQK